MIHISKERMATTPDVGNTGATPKRIRSRDCPISRARAPGVSRVGMNPHNRVLETEIRNRSTSPATTNTVTATFLLPTI